MWKCHLISLCVRSSRNVVGTFQWAGGAGQEALCFCFKGQHPLELMKDQGVQKSIWNIIRFNNRGKPASMELCHRYWSTSGWPNLLFLISTPIFCPTDGHPHWTCSIMSSGSSKCWEHPGYHSFFYSRAHMMSQREEGSPFSQSRLKQAWRDWLFLTALVHFKIKTWNNSILIHYYCAAKVSLEAFWRVKAPIFISRC